MINFTLMAWVIEGARRAETLDKELQLYKIQMPKAAEDESAVAVEDHTALRIKE